MLCKPTRLIDRLLSVVTGAILVCCGRRMTTRGGNVMMKVHSKTNRFVLAALALAAICGLSVLLPRQSHADLNHLACDAAWRGCLGKCAGGSNSQACTDRCDDHHANCLLGGDTLTKQQTPPPPCTGFRCTLHNPHPPTTVGPTTQRPRPYKPVDPVGLSNPNKTTTGNNPVILERGHESGGGQGHGH
jgi:hypothetical protein